MNSAMHTRIPTAPEYYDSSNIVEEATICHCCLEGLKFLVNIIARRFIS